MIFIDGVGIGDADPEKNPFVKRGFKTFEKIFGSIPHKNNSTIIKPPYYLFPSDPVMGIKGFPQSGTGQVSIFCGMNAPEFVGKHFGPFPYSTTIPIIKEENILHHYKKIGRRVFFANAYPDVFFNYINSGKERLSVTALSCKLSGIRLNDADDVKRGSAITAEITNARWNKKLSYNLEVISPQTAALRLLNLAYENDFTLYEFFLTDHLGHGRIKDEFDEIYNNIDEFLITILNEMDLLKLTLIICSDHGNIEDISIKTHTMNNSLTITAGKHAKELYENIKDLSDIKPAIINYCK